MTSPIPHTVDIIFAGGGTSACVAAGRLARANPQLRILLVEGGKNNFEDPMVVNPAVYTSHLVPGSKTVLVSFAGVFHSLFLFLFLLLCLEI